jgi:hypothetical protein
MKEVAMTHGALRVSAIALGAAAFVSLSPLSAAVAATSATTPEAVQHTYVHHYTPRAHTIWRNGRRYVWNVHSYGYNPGAAVAAGVIGGVAGAVAGYPYACYNWPYDGYCPAYSWGGYYGPGWSGWGYGYGPGWYRHGWYGHGYGSSHPFTGGSFGHMNAFAGGNFGHFGGGHFGGFGGGHFGGGARVGR